jgi:hypothetical protein
MRRVPRIKVKMGVMLESKANVTIQVVTADLGLRGAFLTIPAQYDAPPILNLYFRLPQSHQELKILARVAWSNEQGVGVEFLDLTPEGTRLLWEALKPFWPKDLEQCPYCGRSLNSGQRSVCPFCQLPLNFQDDDYLKKLPTLRIIWNNEITHDKILPANDVTLITATEPRNEVGGTELN